MAREMTLAEARAALQQLHFGEQGLTRNDMRAQLSSLPDSIYLHLPDSKRFYNADEVLHEARTAAGRAEGEFIAAGDDTEDAEADYGPAGYSDSLLIDSGVVGPSANTPVPGFDGDSLETENEFPKR